MSRKRPNGAGTVYRRADGRFEASWRAVRDGESLRRHAYYRDESEAWQRLMFELGLESLAPGTRLPETIRAAVEAGTEADLARVVKVEGGWLIGNSAVHAQGMAQRITAALADPFDLVRLRDALVHSRAGLDELAGVDDAARVAKIGAELLQWLAPLAEQVRRAQQQVDAG